MPTQKPSEIPSITITHGVGWQHIKVIYGSKEKCFTTDLTMDKISKYFHSFVEIIGPKFKTLAEAGTRNAESATRQAKSVVRNAEIAALREAIRMEIEEKLKL